MRKDDADVYAVLFVAVVILGLCIALGYQVGHALDAVSAECRARKGAPVVMVGGEFICVQPMPVR